jgi:hypothetical protein
MPWPLLGVRGEIENEVAGTQVSYVPQVLVVCTFNGDSELQVSKSGRMPKSTFNGDSKLVVHTEFPPGGMSE